MSQTLRFHSRMDAVQAPIIQVISALIREVPGTISLGQGVVHYGPPQAAIDAAHTALGRAATHEYQDGQGLAPLVETLAAKLKRENGIDVARGSRIMVTAGANMAFMHAVLAITQPGDEIILNAPFYFNHEMAVQMAGCVPVTVPTDAHYQPRPDALRRAITSRTRAIVTVSPNNPSGAVFTEANLREVSAICREHGIYHLADEVYEYFTFGSATHVSPASWPGADEYTISMYSLSKAYGFAGWRIGYLVYPESLADAIAKCQDTILVCPTVIAQEAAIAALGVGRAYCEPHVRELASIRDIVSSNLSSLGALADVSPAEGAFYVLLKVHAKMTPLALAERLIREHRIAVTPADAFGMHEGCCFRVAYGALQKATVAEGIGRLVTGLRAILG